VRKPSKSDRPGNPRRIRVWERLICRIGDLVVGIILNG
jgi:hypothetical protein